jgi:hypothetical protein
VSVARNDEKVCAAAAVAMPRQVMRSNMPDQPEPPAETPERGTPAEPPERLTPAETPERVTPAEPPERLAPE